ncbi:amino acid adenylation domain-containing protein [Streptomyces sp. NPDC101062]|uniref:amino acid adenylation domain-containing protein n=1 Tax=unclassified Streptomyces TaxID=2593676 RepID=UPI0038178B79
MTADVSTPSPSPSPGAGAGVGAGEPPPLLLHERFAAVARALPDAPAMTSREGTVGYAALARRARHRAAWLRAAGVGPEAIVGIHLDRSAEAVVTMLAVLRAGAAYLPLPLDYPAARLALMARESRMLTVVARKEAPGPFTDVAALFLEEEPAADPTAEPAEPPEPVVIHPDNLAYLVYTSGSSGAPKPVGVTHRGAVNLVDPRQDYVDFRPGETFLQLAPLAFDVAAFEIWGALTNGGRLVVPAPSYQAVEELPDVLVQERVTTMLITTTLFNVLWDARPEALDSVRRLIVGGSVMSADRARQFLERHRRRGADNRLINGYGPSEATTLDSAYSMETLPEDEDNPPLGTAIDGVSLRLLNERLRPVRTGEEGQIFIGGTAVTRGYLHRPGATSLRFVPDPYAVGARMYATGDKGRLRRDGLIEFTGRFDDQVKVRGYRVELGEVEAAVRDHARVRDAAVVLVRGDSGAERLVAHLVPRTPGADLAAAVAAHVADVLPEFMRPASYVHHEVMPRGLTGKIDREALVRLSVRARDGGGGTGSVGRMSRTEAVLAGIWAELLGVEEVGRDDDFFDLGGDSLLAVHAVLKAEERGVPVTLAQVFTRTGLGELCEELERNEAAGTGREGTPSG